MNPKTNDKEVILEKFPKEQIEESQQIEGVNNGDFKTTTFGLCCSLCSYEVSKWSYPMTYRTNMYQHINHTHGIHRNDKFPNKENRNNKISNSNVSIQEENVPLDANSLEEKLENHKEDQISLANEKESVTIFASDSSQNQMVITNKEIEIEKKEERSLDRKIPSSPCSKECEPMTKLSNKKELINTERKCQYCKSIFFAGHGNNACKLCSEKRKTDIYGQIRKEHSKEKDPSKTQTQNISTTRL